MIQKQFITYNLKSKGNNPYPFLLIESSLSPIESMAMFRYLMYKKKLYNMETKRLPKIASNSSENPHLWFKRGWHKDAQYWLDGSKIKDEVILQNLDNIKIIITSKFKEKLLGNKELEGKTKLWYYKEMINLILKNKIKKIFLSWLMLRWK